MEVHGVLLDVQARIVSRIVDPESESDETGEAVGRLRARHEPVTAETLAHEGLDAGSQSRAQRVAFDLHVRVVSVRVEGEAATEASSTVPPTASPSWPATTTTATVASTPGTPSGHTSG